MPDRERELQALRVALHVIHVQIEQLHENICALRRHVDTLGQQVGNESADKNIGSAIRKEKTPGVTGGSDG